MHHIKKNCIFDLTVEGTFVRKYKQKNEIFTFLFGILLT